MAPLKKKHDSRSKKKSWRKNIDLKDVDDFLEDVRLEERLGGKFSERKDEDLFSIDAVGDKDKERPIGLLYDLKRHGLGEKTSYRLKETIVPKCFSSLVNKSAVPDPFIKRNRRKTIEEKRHPAVKKILQHRLENGILTAKEKQAIKDRERHEAAKEKKPKRGEFNYDIWSETNNTRNLEGCADWLTNDTLRHTLHNTGKKSKQVPVAMKKKTSLLPSVEAPHPGISYNPSLKHHREVLEAVVENEVRVEKEEKHLKRVTTNMFQMVKREVAEKEWLTEMSAGLHPEENNPDDDDEGDYATVNPPVKNKKKTLQKRRKLREALALKEKLKLQKIEKRKASDIYKLRKFKRQLDKDEAITSKRIEKRKEIKEKKPFTTKLLSQTKFTEGEIDFTMAQDLKGNLRGLKPEGNLLGDRYKSLQKRNILEPAVRRHVKRRKTKKYERAATKLGFEPKGY